MAPAEPPTGGAAVEAAAVVVKRPAFTLDLVTRRKQPPTPTSVLEPAPSSPASSAASSVAGSVSGRPPSAPGDAAASPPDEAAPAVLLHRRSIVVAYRSPADPARAPADIPAATPNTLGQAALAVVTLALFFGLAAGLPVLIGLSFLAALFLRSALAAAFLAAIAAAALLPAGRKSQAFRHARVWDAWRRHFRLRASVPTLPYVDPAKNYMVVMAPHSVFPMGTWLNAGITDAPGGGMPSRVECVVADVLLKLPIYKHLFAWIGCHSADAKTVRRLLKDRSVAICPEGLAGIFHGASRGDGDERVFLAQRRGFVRLAIQAGTPLLPVYHMGASQLLRFVGLPRLSRRLRASVGLWCGIWGSPLPHRHDIITVVGEPVPVVQCDNPTQEQVDATHAAFCGAVQELFDAHKHLMPGWDTKKLRIV